MVLAVLESTMRSVCSSYKIWYQEAAMTVLAVSAVVAVPVVTASPLKLNPPFPILREKKKKPIFIACERFARIASSL